MDVEKIETEIDFVLKKGNRIQNRYIQYFGGKKTLTYKTDQWPVCYIFSNLKSLLTIKKNGFNGKWFKKM